MRNEKSISIDSNMLSKTNDDDEQDSTVFQLALILTLNEFSQKILTSKSMCNIS